jgi:nucleotide-binding universal stress UspA family protein
MGGRTTHQEISMTTETRGALSPPTPARTPVTSYRHLFEPDVSFKLLLALDNDDNAPAAIELTAALTHRGAKPTVLRTLELMAPVPGGNAADTTFLYAQAALGGELSQGQENIITHIIRETLGSAPPWPIKVVVGDPAATISYVAEEERAELLVMGIHHHGKLSQAIGENTATRVMSKASMPVLGVRKDTMTLPRLVMVATDFGNASWEAAHLAANLVDPQGTVVIVHVSLPVPLVEEGDEGAALVQREGIEHSFERLADEIKVGKSIDVKLVTREGDPATELLIAAEKINPDLIATASQRHRLLTRLLLGSVSRKLMRDGRWSMLIAPPAPREA